LGGVVLGTGVAQSMPRSIGAVVPQTGSSGYGVAFFDGPTLRLWDAGEVEDTDVCP